MSLSLALSVTPETLAFTAALAATGLSSSFIGGVVGAGGGLIAIPLTQYIFMQFGLDSPTAMLMTVGTMSLAMIFSSALATWREARGGLIEWDAMRAWIVPVLAGVVSMHALGLGQNGAVMKLAFAALVVGVAVYMMFGSDKWRLYEKVPLGPVWSALGLAFGFICSLVGTGGAIIAVPLLHACGVPLHRAITSSAVLGLMVGIPSAVFAISGPTLNLPATIGSVNFLAAGTLVAAGWLGRPLGLWVQRQMSADMLRKAFVGILLLSATRLCWMTLVA